MTTKLITHPAEPVMPVHLERIAAAVDSRPEGDDAAVLATAISRAVNGDLRWHVAPVRRDWAR